MTWRHAHAMSITQESCLVCTSSSRTRIRPLPPPRIFRHSSPVSLRLLQRRISLLLQRPIGLLVSSVMMAAMLSTAISAGEIHAHVGADQGHHHSTPVPAAAPPDQGDLVLPSDPALTVLHAHDVCTTVQAVFGLPLLAFGVVTPMPPSAPIADCSPPTSAHVPPHRPPIA